jgi:hypothetical protein
LKEPILVIANTEKLFELETDASNFALGKQLGQKDLERQIHPVAFYSKKFNGLELNYPIHNKELIAVIEGFKEWKHYFSRTTYKIKVYTDYKNLTAFITTKELNKRQIQ